MMKLQIVNRSSFDKWRSQAIQRVGSNYGEDWIELLNVSKLQTSPFHYDDLKIVNVNPTDSIEKAIHHLTGKKPVTTERYQEKIKTTTRCLYFLPVSADELEYALTFADYDIQENDILLYAEYVVVEPDDTRYRVSLIRDVTDFCRIVRSLQDIEKSPGLLFRPPPPPKTATHSYLASLMVGSMFHNPGLRPIESVLLYTDEDVKLAEYIRYNFAALDEMTGHHLNIYAIEKPTEIKGVSSRAYWKARLEQNAYSFLNLMGWTAYKPYEKKDAYKIAALFGVYPDTLPCMVLFGDIKSDKKIVITIATEEFSAFFRKVSSIVLQTFEKIVRSKTKLSDFNEFRDLFMEQWREWQKELEEKKKPLSTFTFNGNTVFINRPSGATTIRDFQKGDNS